MKALVKKLAKKLAFVALGEDRARCLAFALRGQKPAFSEADLVLSWCRKNVRDDGVMIDVGAHHGESLLPYLNLGWRVIAFEPDPANRAKLIQAIDPRRIRLYDCAVGESEQDEIPFYASKESTGISSLAKFRDTHEEIAKVRIVTLASVIAAEGVDRVDFLKVDTEGFDLFVLKGFPFAQIKPRVVLVEFEDFKTVPLGYDYRTMGDFLLARGYQVFLSEWAPIVRYGGNHEWRSWRLYPCSLANPKGWGNFVAFRPGLDFALVTRYLRKFQSHPKC